MGDDNFVSLNLRACAFINDKVDMCGTDFRP